MSTHPAENVVIVGTGCAGLTAAVYAARASLSPLVLEGPLPGGQLTTTSEVENFPGFPEGVDGFALMDSLRKQATRFGARFEQALVQSVDFAATPRRLVCADREVLAKAVIIATGASPRMTGIPGEKELFGGKGVSTCATCDGAFYRKMDVAVIGGGDSAAEEALFLTRFANKVYLVHRRDALRASRIMSERATSHPKIQPVWDTVPVEAVGVAEGALSGLKVRHAKSGAESILPVKGVFVAIGHVPNTAAFAGALDVDANGYFVPSAGSQVKTKIPGVYVAGDCADHVYRQAVTAAGMGCQAAIEAERWLAEHGGVKPLGIPDGYAAARCLAQQPEATELVTIGATPDGRDIRLSPGAAGAWAVMRDAASKSGIEIVVLSGFRSVARQRALIDAKLASGQPIEEILRTVAPPGFSEHHTGRALDVAVPGQPALTEAFAETPAFEWLSRNAGAFGFRMSYPKDNPQGFIFEPWHWFFEG